jgi:membrane protease YdiL (CAAX protease family)
MNLMLIAAAAVCGAFWSLMFMRYKSIWLNIVSHVVWDVMIFLVWPLT